ncbi:hypothetical protein BST81_20515 [Leptolyngbya sp. 'hensonii']|uniref:J domain-containing protein n=1 Tax=Leptolyngbya sp. 'hensonii' TaxID=1922337 RepID=UPI00094F5433|nr:J domain-containing protein [Leptolyngbya sp. 'hensonii']OLP16583.1 hypothetical protein BST81_20515 [Leptolyngbya sp. 'hensonii']
MSFQIQRGLFNLDFIDCHAILGVPVDADAKEVRKRYLKIARSLHPDSFSASSEVEKQRAVEMLSKLVNPAYEKLSQEKERTEYTVMLRLKGQQAARQQDSLSLASELAQQLSRANEIDQNYKKYVQQLSEQQYQTLDQIIEVTGQLSELNLVYLMRKTAKNETVTSSATPNTTATPSQATNAGRSSTVPNYTPPAARVNIIDQFYRRAEEYLNGNNLAKAVLELRDALQAEPNNARCHSLLGTVYLKQNQMTMAKIHFNKALQINPADEMAQKGIKQLEKLSGKPATSTGGKSTGAKATPKTGQKTPPKSDQSGGGGFFGGLFGGGKKK